MTTASGSHTLRQGSSRLPQPAWGVTLLAVTAVQPGWFLLLTGSFTEPLLMLLVVGFLAVQREHPTWGVVLLGLGLGAKQHLLLAIPAVLIGWSRYDRRSGAIAVLTAIGAFSIGVVFGPIQFLSATVVDPAASAPSNLQSVTLTGLWLPSALRLQSLRWYRSDLT